MPPKYAVATLNQTPLDWNGNRRRILEVIREAQNQGVTLLILPELVVSGFGCQNHFRRPDVYKYALDSLERIVPEANNITVNMGFPFMEDGKRYNAAAWIRDGKIDFIHIKTRLQKRYFHEKHWFDKWCQHRISRCEFFGKEIYYGDYHHFSLGEDDLDKGIFVNQTCGDPNWSAFRKDCDRVDLRIISSASPFALGKQERRLKAIRQFSEQNQCVCLYANLLGCEGTPYIFDGTAIIADHGKIVAQTPPFSYREWNLITSEPEKQVGIFPSAYIAEKEFAESLSLALFDYMRKSRSSGYVLSLSGGADSAAIAVLVAAMVQNAWAELTPQEFFNRLNYLPQLRECQTPEDVIEKLLTCVYQRSGNSSDTTRNAAKTLATSLGAAFHEISIETLIEKYTNLIAPIYGKQPQWESDDKAMQNIQARVRVPSVWFLANLKNALLLNTGNRSEATLGYATMDGDTCGALSPIGGIDKAFLRRWLRFWEKDANGVPALSVINEQEPTAELRPRKFDQKDEDDLMPYTILNRLERLIIRNEMTPNDAAKQLLNEYPEYTKSDMQIWSERFYTLWTRNQWKRCRYAMSFHVDDKTVSPDDWRQFPNISEK